MGVGATHTMERLAASIGALDGAPVVFQAALDVPHGGVLFALPALLATGLLRHAATYFSLPRGYYRLDTLLIVLAFMALARLKTLESVRYVAPGEWGKLVGMDRIPEVRTLRSKLAILAQTGEPEQWSATLCQEWMQADPEAAQVLYVDGHVRVYHGQTRLPRHYVARKKMALRATTDYWVHAMNGQPFLLVHLPLDPGLIEVLRNDLLPWLDQNVPNQPSEEELDADPLRHRFTLVFDREGYSPALFRFLKEQRLACMTYHKYPGDPWPEEEFSPVQTTLASGANVSMDLAERGTRLGDDLWVREIRKRCASGHQTSILALDYSSEPTRLAPRMFARWSQENFFKYMREQYSLDKLVDYGTMAFPDTFQVVNPAYRKLDSQVRSQVAKLARKQAEFGALLLEEDIETDAVEVYEQEKAALRDEVEARLREVELLKTQRRNTDRYIDVDGLPDDEQFEPLKPLSKHIIDTVKMIAYRAETSMTNLVKEKMARLDDARPLLRGLYATEADILPDEERGTLTVRLHHLATHCSDQTLEHLCAELNATESIFPGTKLRLVYELVSGGNP